MEVRKPAFEVVSAEASHPHDGRSLASRVQPCGEDVLGEHAEHFVVPRRRLQAHHALHAEVNHVLEFV